MGNYLDPDNVSHGFLTDRNGVFTTFDAPVRPVTSQRPFRVPIRLESMQMERSRDFMLTRQM